MVRATVRAVLLFVSSRVYAQSDAEVAARISPALEKCQSAFENGGTFQQAMCEGAEASRQDQQLNKTWARVIVSLPPAEKKALRDKQRAWISQRDSDCQSEANDYANSTAKYMFAACIVDETIRRTMWLERLARTPVHHR